MISFERAIEIETNFFRFTLNNFELCDGFRVFYCKELPTLPTHNFINTKFSLNEKDLKFLEKFSRSEGIQLHKRILEPYSEATSEFELEYFLCQDPAMAAESFKPTQNISNDVLHVVETDDIDQFVSTMCITFELDETFGRWLKDTMVKLKKNVEIHNYIGFCQGEPVATCSRLVSSESVNFVANGSVSKAYRNRGFYRSLISSVLNNVTDPVIRSTNNAVIRRLIQNVHRGVPLGKLRFIKIEY